MPFGESKACKAGPSKY
uniref:Uncharacterized protein n=1 Tax=Arundo donax TaxID=35708 RepID=A0A0A9AIM9_ARUDO